MTNPSLPNDERVRRHLSIFYRVLLSLVYAFCFTITHGSWDLLPRIAVGAVLFAATMLLARPIDALLSRLPDNGHLAKGPIVILGIIWVISSAHSWLIPVITTGIFVLISPLFFRLNRTRGPRQ